MDRRSVEFPCIKVTQPIGDFYIGAISSIDLCELTHVDVRRIEGERGFETYLGIQRPLSQSRVKELAEYVQSPDACFPTAVILAVPPECANYDDEQRTMSLSTYEDPDDPDQNIEFRQIGKVIDGQHRIEGLKTLEKTKVFDINVSIFVDMDIADQAYLFSTVNLAQTKVNRSLVYDLFDLAKARSPQKTCHEIAVALDRNRNSPFFGRIKRLGVSTEGHFGETITQATFVQALLAYISPNPLKDRNLYLKGGQPRLASKDELRRYIFRNMFIEEKDLDITDVVWNYFQAVARRWSKAWSSSEKGLILNKTNGFCAFMRFLPHAYLHLGKPGDVFSANDFYSIMEGISLRDYDFSTDDFKPGTSGESSLFHTLLELSKLR